MADKPVFWNRHNDEDRVAFARFLNPLVIAAYPSKVQRDKNFGRAEASVYMLTLQDVPRDILALGVSKLLEDGVTWMPKPGDIKHACADIVDEMRTVAARVAKSLQEDCADCHGSGWANAEGPNAVVKCRCVTCGLELLAQAGNPIARPTLPPASEPESVV